MHAQLRLRRGLRLERLTSTGYAPWLQGFDEFIGIQSGQTDQFKLGTLECSPNKRAWFCYDPEEEEFPTQDEEHVPCTPATVGNDDGKVTESKCVYTTRWMRDHAINFIKRHRTDALGGKPFFLFVGFTATHVPHQAPERTKAHYDGDGDLKVVAPGGKTKYWAMLEELDAAVGSIMSKLEEEDEHGRLIDNTLVLFTSDHGRSGSLYGNPQLRGGKSNLLEGGMRVGLLARGDGLFGRQTTLVTDDATVGSFIDFFPTIAAAAGYADLNRDGSAETDDTAFGSDGRLEPLKVCETTGRECDGSCNCLTKALDGKSLLPVFSGEEPAVRDFAFAHYKNDTETLATKKGYFAEIDSQQETYATHVCGFDIRVRVCTDDEGITCTSDQECILEDAGTCGRLVRHVRGASCAPCTTDQECTGTQETDAEICDLLGGVCVTEAQAGACTDNPNGQAPQPCPFADLPRCRKQSDCPSQTKCIFNARDRCETCVPAAWKYRKAGKKDPGLYDLTSNPEEDVKNFGSDDGTFAEDPDDNGRLNCLDDPNKNGDNEDEKVRAVQACLDASTGAWRACLDDGQEDSCEEMHPTACAPPAP